MKLWLISQKSNNNYDTFDSAVVAADSEREARETNPDGVWGSPYSAWCGSPDEVTAELIGDAAETVERGIVLGSFNAG